MRIYLAKRILMNEADASSGNGAPAAPPVPAESPAATATPAPAPAISADQVKGLINEQLGGFKNSFFAELRKAGLLGKEKPTESPTPPSPASPSAAAPASSGLSMDDVKAIVARERVVTLAAAEHKLSAAQMARMTSALESERPEDPGVWVKTYLTDMGLAKQPEPAAATAANPVPTPQPTGQPVSDKGSPAPGGVVNWERELAENPVGMSAAARAAMDAKHGVEVARKMRLEAAQAQLKRIQVTK